MPIKNRVLIWMGYEKRRCQHINNQITITDRSGVIVSFLSYGATSSDDIRLGIVEIKSKYDRRVFLKDEYDKFGNVLNVGSYTLELESWDNGRQLLKKAKHFRVNPKYPYVEWLSKM